MNVSGCRDKISDCQMPTSSESTTVARFSGFQVLSNSAHNPENCLVLDNAFITIQALPPRGHGSDTSCLWHGWKIRRTRRRSGSALVGEGVMERIDRETSAWPVFPPSYLSLALPPTVM